MNKRRNYSYLLDEFGEIKLRDRYIFLEEAGNYFILSKKINEHAYINSEIVEEIILDYFSDISRLKKFHEIEQANFIKIASYLTYWTVKRKPIQIKNTKIMDNLQFDFMKNINEWFACSLFISICYDTNIFYMTDSTSMERYNDFYKNLNYYFTYREITPQSLEMILIALNVNVPIKTQEK